MERMRAVEADVAKPPWACNRKKKWSLDQPADACKRSFFGGWQAGRIWRIRTCCKDLGR